MRQFTIKFDGSCWPNPGTSIGWGYQIIENGRVINQASGYSPVSPSSNNYAEFYALYQALLTLSNLVEPEETGRIIILGDSSLVINVLNKRFAAKGGAYLPAYELVMEMIKIFRKQGFVFTYNWIPRENNTDCDDLSKAYITESKENDN
jgi:ribonuclease HI